MGCISFSGLRRILGAGAIVASTLVAAPAGASPRLSLEGTTAWGMSLVDETTRWRPEYHWTIGGRVGWEWNERHSLQISALFHLFPSQVNRFGATADPGISVLVGYRLRLRSRSRVSPYFAGDIGGGLYMMDWRGSPTGGQPVADPFPVLLVRPGVLIHLRKGIWLNFSLAIGMLTKDYPTALGFAGIEFL